MRRKLFCGVARFPSDSGADFLIGSFTQRKFELRSKNTAKKGKTVLYNNPLLLTVPFGQNPHNIIQ
jgi:hypothetical protein